MLIYFINILKRVYFFVKEVFILPNYNKNELLNNAKEFFDEFFENRVDRLKKKKESSFKSNPFLIRSLAMAFSPNITAKTKAKALVYPFALGTSINTSFGENIQNFIIETVPNAFGSTTSGMDIEFIDQLDGNKKYCQIKSGPQTINKADIKSIEGDFKNAVNLARINRVTMATNDLVLGVIYGTHDDLNNMYKTIESHGYNVLVGSEFWEHLTGFSDFYNELIKIAQNSARKVKMDNAIKELIARTENYIKKNPSLF